METKPLDLMTALFTMVPDPREPMGSEKTVPLFALLLCGTKSVRCVSPATIAKWNAQMIKHLFHVTQRYPTNDALHAEGEPTFTETKRLLQSAGLAPGMVFGGAEDPTLSHLLHQPNLTHTIAAIQALHNQATPEDQARLVPLLVGVSYRGNWIDSRMEDEEFYRHMIAGMSISAFIKSALMSE